MSLPKVRKLMTVLGIGGLGILLTSCPEEKGSDTPSQAELTFQEKAKTVVLGAGKFGDIPQVQSELEDEYDDFDEIDLASTWTGEDNDNALGYRPFRFELDLSEGDGSGTDVACTSLRLPAGTQHVFATRKDDEPATLSVDPDLEYALVCFEPSGHPGNVVAWASQELR